MTDLVPLEEETECDVVGVGRELPEERGALVVRGHAHRHRLAVPHLAGRKAHMQPFTRAHKCRLIKQQLR